MECCGSIHVCRTVPAYQCFPRTVTLLLAFIEQMVPFLNQDMLVLAYISLFIQVYIPVDMLMPDIE
jgi:hypothetical protein